jgi:hypothetical protein
MALKKSIEINHSGYFAEYWRAIQLNVNTLRSDAIVYLAAYKDRETRDANKLPTDLSVQVDLNLDFLQKEIEVNGRTTTLRDVLLEHLYTCFKERVSSEVAKPDTVLDSQGNEIENPDKNFEIARFNGVQDI